MKIPYFEMSLFCMGDFKIGLKVASEYWTGEYCVCNFVMEVFRHNIFCSTQLMCYSQCGKLRFKM